VDRQEPGPRLWPSTGEAAELLSRLMSPDRLATAAFADAYLELLITHLRAKHPNADDHVRCSAASDALISLFKNPARYDPTRGSLAVYLRMSVVGDMRNLLKCERRHHDRRENWDSVELDADARNSEDEADEDDLPAFDHPALASVIAAFTVAELAAFKLMRDGVRRTEVFADVLGLGHLSAGDQTTQVKRIKDRIIVRLRRAAEGES